MEQTVYRQMSFYISIVSFDCKYDVSIIGTYRIDPIFDNVEIFILKILFHLNCKRANTTNKNVVHDIRWEKLDILHFTSKDISLIIHRNSLLHWISPHQQDKKLK